MIMIRLECIFNLKMAILKDSLRTMMEMMVFFFNLFLPLCAKCIEALGKGCLSDQDMGSLVSLMDKLLKQHFMRHVERQEKRKDEDYDDIVEESLMDEVSKRKLKIKGRINSGNVLLYG